MKTFRNKTKNEFKLIYVTLKNYLYIYFGVIANSVMYLLMKLFNLIFRLELKNNLTNCLNQD